MKLFSTILLPKGHVLCWTDDIFTKNAGMGFRLHVISWFGEVKNPSACGLRFGEKNAVQRAQRSAFDAFVCIRHVYMLLQNAMGSAMSVFRVLEKKENKGNLRKHLKYHSFIGVESS